jgi:probable F420-dependent oxidoreductase
MKVDGVMTADPARSGAGAADMEAAGFDGVWTGETNHDPFLACLLAAEHTSRIEVGTSIAIAFARSPMTLAATANDLQAFSEGRFNLGLGSQIQAHIERRFSMPWSKPAARMRELVSAMRAIWSSWHEGTKLDFRGDFYSHTLMTPMFNPGPNPYGPPKVFLAGVGGLMTEVAGEVGDGFICHSFTTDRYLREVTWPALERGRAKVGKTMEGFDVIGPFFVVTGTTEEELAASAKATKQQIAFYGSTPAYRPVLELHGWGELQSELNAMSKRGQWVEMGEVIDDEVLHTFAVVGEPDAVPAELLKRFGSHVTRLTFYDLDQRSVERWRTVREGLQAS